MVVAAQHRDVAWTRRTAAVERDRVVGVAAAGGAAAAGEAAPAIAGLDETAHTRRHPITVVAMVTIRLSAMDTTRLSTTVTTRLSTTVTTRLSTTVTTRLSTMDTARLMVWLWDAPAGLQTGQ
jgi:hypothetical protein